VIENITFARDIEICAFGSVFHLVLIHFHIRYHTIYYERSNSLGVFIK
jgi:hypothetical protein